MLKFFFADFPAARTTLVKSVPADLYPYIAHFNNDPYMIITTASVELNKEYELLHLFLQNKNQVFSREQLLNRIWGFDFEGNTRTVDSHIKTLRQKLGTEGRHIVTLIRSGYKFEVKP